VTGFRWDWVVSQRGEILERFLEHAHLTGLAVGIGFLISFPLALYVQRHRRLYSTVASIAGVLYTIPSLALFAFLVPFTGLTVLTAQIGLVSYTLLILIRNIVTGLDGVPEDAKEAALGMGYTPRQMRWHVELPLAVPAIIAGIRIAAVTTIGLVTVTALIGQGGFGFFIVQRGLRGYHMTALVVGVVLSVAFAILADLLLLALEKGLTPWSRRRRGEGLAR
jgi:osmoprotectant transport system permease protein